MKIGIFSDIHANFPALEAALQFFDEQGCERVIHLGDMIGIGPHPREVVERCSQYQTLDCIMGNHDYWYAHGLPNPQPAWMSDEEVAHQQWTHAQLGSDFKDYFRKWPWKFSLQLSNGQKVTCLHYALNKNQNWFLSVVREPSIKDLDNLFLPNDEDYILYGHHHVVALKKGPCNYINPGSAGCHDKSTARLCILDDSTSEIFSFHEQPYDDNGLMESFDERQIPARDFIRKVFITR